MTCPAPGRPASTSAASPAESRWCSATRSPPRARAWAIARRMPRDAPVTRMARLSTPHDLTAYAERGDRQPISAFPCRPLLALMSATNRVDQGSLGEERVAGIGKAITGARVVPVEGEPIDGGTVMIEAGKIVPIWGPGFAGPHHVQGVDPGCQPVLPGFSDAPPPLCTA